MDRNRLGIVLLLLAIAAPAGSPQEAEPAVTFEDAAAAAGLVDLEGTVLDSPDVSFVDLDGDGAPEAVVGGRIHFNRSGRFLPGPETGGPGICFADFDGDGDVDFLSAAGRNLSTVEGGAAGAPALRLFRNEGVRAGLPRWTDATELSGIAGCEGAAAMAWLDCDGDEILDLYIGCSGRRPGTEQKQSLGDRLFRGLGEGRFEDATAKTGLTAILRPAAAIAPCDFDVDGDIDVYVANAHLAENALWHNAGGGVFADVAGALGLDGGGLSHSSSACWLDCDNDGDADLLVVNMKREIEGQARTVLYRNNGDGSFADITAQAGLHHAPGDGFADEVDQVCAAAGDFDNDGWIDLFITESCEGGTNSRAFPPPHRVAGGESRFYRNTGEGVFEEIRSAVLNRPDTQGAAAGDFDGDGRLDILVGSGNRRCPPVTDADFSWYVPGASRVALLRNTTAKAGAWLKVRLESRSCPLPGTRVVVVTRSGRRITRYLSAGFGGGTAASNTLHFGLGREPPRQIEIYWPDGTLQMLQTDRINRIVTASFRRGDRSWTGERSEK